MKKTLLALGAGLLVGLAPCQATVLSVDDGWTVFRFDGPGSSLAGAPFSFSFGAGGGVLSVTDSFFAGDRFALFDGGVALGLTSAPEGDGGFIDDFDQAFGDPRWSHGSWRLGAGSHSITSIAVDSPFYSGAGGLRIVASPVPEAGGAGALLAGLALLGLWRRRRG
ncbi:hypothetical protein [Derxia lacustris]|uniref:hypothetical protein n=1 Tax=Derxia lacustris TaxID=764842 RepID=UPI000A16FEDA|nr:hypothetical protein [Derxia lacustris]